MSIEEKIGFLISYLSTIRREVSEEDWSALSEELINFLGFTADEFAEYEAECRGQHYT